LHQGKGWNTYFIETDKESKKATTRSFSKLSLTTAGRGKRDSKQLDNLRLEIWAFGI
jgi:hypothetical protein